MLGYGNFEAEVLLVLLKQKLALKPETGSLEWLCRPW
jgi:hypothetical protein